MQGRGDTSSGNSARLKDACTASELTTSRFLDGIIIFFLFSFTRETIFFNHRTIVTIDCFNFENDFYLVFLILRVVRISLKIKRDCKNQYPLSKEKWESFKKFEEHVEETFSQSILIS